MGKTILTSKQSQFLDYIQKEPHITRRFYLTGGTALSGFYLKHRLSFDLDFFTEKEEVDESSLVIVPFNKQDMEKFFLQLAKSLKGDIFK